MCGFVGIYNPKKVSHDAINLLQLASTLAHRGPDGQGFWISDDQTFLCAHVRLSLIDLTDAAKQPMVDDTKSVVLLFNGEIYNYKDIRLELQHLGFRFTSTSDTEVFLLAYKAWGISFLRKLKGMFAAALYDDHTKQLFLIRDRIGIKPLYFSMQNNMVSFASEIKVLWQLPWMKKTPHYQAISHYLTFLSTPAPLTIYEQIYKLPAGYYAIVDDKGSITFQKWYDILSTKITCEDNPEKQLSSLLTSSVNQHLETDVPVGIFLSGGLDSSILARLMVQKTSNIKSFNVYFVDEPNESQEREWASLVAKEVKAQHYEIGISELDAFKAFSSVVYQQDEPLADCVCIPLYYISAAARQQGVKTVFIGEGSDELFAGYAYYQKIMKLQWYWQTSIAYLPTFLRASFAQAIYNFVQHPNKKELLQLWAKGDSLFYGSTLGFYPAFKESIMNRSSFASKDSLISFFPHTQNSFVLMNLYRQHMPSQDALQQMFYLELQHRLPELLLMRADKMTMSHSIEARVPFLDHELVEFAFHLPAHYKIRDNKTKYLLKKVAEQYLPASVIYRKKMGFAAPITRWFYKNQLFNNHLKKLLQQQNPLLDLFNKKEIEKLIHMHESKTVDYSLQLWILINLFAVDWSQ